MASTGYNATTGQVTASTVVLDMGSPQSQNYPIRLGLNGNPGLVRMPTHQRINNGGFFGGFARFTLGYYNDANVGEHYCGVGSIGGFNTVGDSTRMVVGMLVRYGTTFWSDQIQGGNNKQIILVTNQGERPMMNPKWSGTTRVLAPCDGTVCYTGLDNEGGPDYFNQEGHQPDINTKLGQWLWVEFTFNSNTNQTRTKVWSQDGQYNGVEIVAPWASPGAVISQDVIGFVCSAPTMGAQPYYDIERVEYRVGTDAYMTPPTGFPGSLRGGLALTTEWTGWTMPNSTSVASADGETEIGDVLQTTFYPQLKRKKWNNLANFSMRLTLADYLNPNKFACEGSKIIYTKGNYSAEFSFANGVFAFDIVLSAIPPVNYLDWTVNKKDCTLWHQPPLSASEIAEGSIRPDNVINSIAVYSSYRDNQYETGKLGHIYRPQATDALGATAWCDWSIVAQDATTATIRLTCPQAFLNTATYPVRIK